MRSTLVTVAVVMAVACSGYAFAQQQPLTRDACEKAGFKWDDSSNICGGGAGLVPPPMVKTETTPAAPKAEMAPMTPKAEAKPAKPGGAKTVTKKKVVVTKKHGEKKRVIHKKTTTTHHSAATPAPAPKKQGGFFKWLGGKNKKSS